MDKQKIEGLKGETKKIKKEVQQKTIGYIVAGVGVVVGLAWNEAIKAFIEANFPLGSDSVTAKFVYAIIMTVILVVLSTYLARLFKERKEEDG